MCEFTLLMIDECVSVTHLFKENILLKIINDRQNGLTNSVL